MPLEVEKYPREGESQYRVDILIAEVVGGFVKGHGPDAPRGRSSVIESIRDALGTGIGIERACGRRRGRA